MATKLKFQKVGGSLQCLITQPEELRLLSDLDPALWAVLSAPLEALNTNRDFLNYLDSDANRVIRVDDLYAAVRWLSDRLKDFSALNDVAPALELSAIADTPAAAHYVEFIQANPDLTDEQGRLILAKVTAAIRELNGSALHGDGILTAQAVAGSAGETLYLDILKAGYGTAAPEGGTGITLDGLEQFIKAIAEYVNWESNAAKPLYEGQDPAPFFAPYQALRNKLDEFFRYCQLVALNPVNLDRFRLDPKALPPLALNNPAAVAETLQEAPLAEPAADLRLDFSARLNPFYANTLKEFSRNFQLPELTLARWQEIKQALAPYEQYIAKLSGDVAGKLERKTLTGYLDDQAVQALRDRFDEDKTLGARLNLLRDFEKLLLYKQYLFDLVNNFVNFRALFDPTLDSMIQSGTLIMDGRHFDLIIRLRDVAAHKKIVVNSNLCLMYLEIQMPPGQPPQYLAAVITGGSTGRIYPGKGGVFIDKDKRCYNVRVTDFLNGPISFGQSFWQPFRRLGGLVGSRFQKLTDFSPVETQAAEAIKNDKPSNLKSIFTSSPALIMFGGVSLAAVGSSAAFLIKALEKVTWLQLAYGFGIILLAIIVPLVVSALIKLQKRDLGLFLDAAGWAVNLPMRLSYQVSRIFTYRAPYPPGAELNRRDICSQYAPAYNWKLLWIWGGILLGIGLLLWYWYWN